MKKIRALCLLFSLLLTALCVAPAAAAESVDKSVVSGCHSVDAALSLSDEAKLTETAKAAIIYELGSDTMIYAWNPDQQIYPTSTAKMMTALIAIEKGNLAQKVTVTKRALSELPIANMFPKDFSPASNGIIRHVPVFLSYCLTSLVSMNMLPSLPLASMRLLPVYFMK